MRDPHVTDLLPAYALGALEVTEVDLVERHLATCESCRAEARLLTRLSDDLLVAPPQHSAPPQLRARVLEQARALRDAAQQANQPAAPHPAPRAPHPIARALWAAFGQPDMSDEADQTLRDLLLDPESAVFAVNGSADAPGATARLVASPHGGAAVLLANGLAAPGAGRAYQVWLLRGGAPAPNSLFSVDQRGRGVGLVRINGDLRAWDTIAVTPEPASGSPAPTGPIVLVGSLTAA